MIKEGLPKQRFLFFDKLIFYVVYAIWLLSDQGNKFIIYSPLLILLIYYIFNKLICRKNENYYNKLFKYFPFLLLIIWSYGVFVGILNGNDNVFVNNAGILFFASYYFITNNNLSISQLTNIIIYLAIASCIYYLVSLKSNILSQVQITNLGIRIGGFTFPGIFAASLLPILFHNILFKRKNIIIIKNIYINYILLILVVFVSVILVASKGIYLSILVTLSILFYYKLRQIKFTFWVFIFIITFLLSSLVVNEIDFDRLVIFSSTDESNLARFKMLDAIWDELTFFGYGWGAKFQSYELSSRDISGYSSELSYMNLIHKIGFFSSIFFLFYGWLFANIIRLVKSKKNDIIGTGLISLGMITYLFTSIGNPSLFSPPLVFMTVMVLHLINKQLILSRNEK
jgi:hypothetical protein